MGLRGGGAPQRLYAALDLGTNNCRLLVARPTSEGFRVVDAFSRIVRLGEGLTQTGRLSDAAIARTLDALRVCRDKIRARGVTRARLIATEACRSAENGPEFLEEVRERLGLQLEVVDRETEAYLAAAGCGELADEEAESTVLFDIGGGSSEIVWMSLGGSGTRRVEAWESMRLGVVSLAETYGGEAVTPQIFADMVRHVDEALAPFVARVAHRKRCDRFHLLGTSGTVTTIAGVHLDLPRYDRRADRRSMDDERRSRRGDRPVACDELCRSRRQRLHRGVAGRSRAGGLRDPGSDPPPLSRRSAFASPIAACARAFWRK